MSGKSTPDAYFNEISASTLKKLHTISVLSCELGLVSTSTAITLLIYLHIGYFSILACNKLLKHLLTKS